MTLQWREVLLNSGNITAGGERSSELGLSISEEQAEKIGPHIQLASRSDAKSGLAIKVDLSQYSLVGNAC